jgi:ribosomal protein S18 acetylase RimI-like enzyme
MDDALLSRIEDASLNASAPPQQRWLDGWILRYSPGKARRARCINAVAAGRLPLDVKLAYATALFAAAGLPMVARITRFTQPPELDSQLAERGWPAVDTTRVQVLANLNRPAPAPLPAGTEWALLTPPEFAEAVGELRGSPAIQRQAHVQRLLTSPVPYQGYVIRRISDGCVLACGQSAREGDLVGLYDVYTHEAQHGLGWAATLCQRLLAQAAADGAAVAYLQVEGGNTTALRVYQRLGFVDGYTYHYREAPAAA